MTQPTKKPGLDNGDKCSQCGELQMPKWSGDTIQVSTNPGKTYSETARCCQNCSFIEERKVSE